VKPLIITYALIITSFWAISQTDHRIEIIVNTDLKILTELNADSIPNGRYNVIFKNKTVLKGQTKEGEKDGKWIVYHDNGQHKMEGFFVNGKKHGEWTYWGKKGEVLAKFQFNHGTRIGHWQGYYPNHKKAIDLVYNPEGNPIQCIQYYPSGIISLNFEYEYVGQVETKNLSYYYENFNLFQYTQLTNNKRNGAFQRYHNNGVIWESFEYQNGQLIRVVETRSKGGMPRKNDAFRDGDGLLKRYYFNGNTYSETLYKNGKKDGNFSLFDKGGDLVGTGNFTLGVPTKKWDVYSQFHNRLYQLDFDTLPGLVYQKIRTSPAEKEHDEGSLFSGYKHGTWSSYDAYGKLISIKNYNYGYLDGKQLYYESEKVIREFSYTNGNKNGESIFYNSFGKVLSVDTYKSESQIDSAWFKPPKKNWIAVENIEPHSNMQKMVFYPPFPGASMYRTLKSFKENKEYMFPVQRNLYYTYWPELVPPQFMGNEYAEKEYINKYLNIPDNLKNQRVDGKVLLRYAVDEFGIISDITVLKSIGLGLDELAVDLIKSYPPLKSATFNGLPISSYIVREIDFRF